MTVGDFIWMSIQIRRTNIIGVLLASTFHVTTISAVWRFWVTNISGNFKFVSCRVLRGVSARHLSSQLSLLLKWEIRMIRSKNTFIYAPSASSAFAVLGIFVTLVTNISSPTVSITRYTVACKNPLGSPSCGGLKLWPGGLLEVPVPRIDLIDLPIAPISFVLLLAPPRAFCVIYVYTISLITILPQFCFVMWLYYYVCELGWCIYPHYNDVIMSTMASQITSVPIVYSTVCWGADQRKYQSSASLAFVWGIHRLSVNSPHKGPVMRKMFPFDYVVMIFVGLDSLGLDYNYNVIDRSNHVSSQIVLKLPQGKSIPKPLRTLPSINLIS